MKQKNYKSGMNEQFVLELILYPEDYTLHPALDKFLTSVRKKLPKGSKYGYSVEEAEDEDIPRGEDTYNEFLKPYNARFWVDTGYPTFNFCFDSYEDYKRLIDDHWSKK